MSAGLGVPDLCVLISGRGSNMQALHRACEAGHLQAQLSHVVSNSEQAEGLHYARENGIETSVVDHREYPDRTEFDLALVNVIDQNPPNLVLLAGFMRKLGVEFTHHFAGRLINIHPSLLPCYPGLDTHSRVLEAKDQWHGCTVHYVNEALDGGPIIAHARVPVKPDDNAKSLAARVLKSEHRLYPVVAQLCLHGGVECQAEQVKINGNTLDTPLLYNFS